MTPRGKPTARLRHALRGDVVILSVTPMDGRYKEDFRVDPSELRRFCWAVLNDLCPEEAAQAAAEEGVDLDLATQEIPVSGRPRRQRSRKHAPEPGSKMHRVLELLHDGHHTVKAIQARAPQIQNLGALLWELRQNGWVMRVDGGPAGIEGLYGLTPAGAALFPQTREAAA
ncbi:hypothetical protein [Caulobacter sp. 1776]|uniref:hypothetical protein n=1 Tax=Caulobacter sp. 1776 TaxID=3156420 RepID=UPI00339AB99D